MGLLSIYTLQYFESICILEVLARTHIAQWNETKQLSKKDQTRKKATLDNQLMAVQEADVPELVPGG